MGSGKLLARLKAEHDANMTPPEGWKPRPAPVIVIVPPTVRSEGESASAQYVPITSQKIIRATARHFDVTVPAMVGKSRKGLIVLARQVAMYLTRELTRNSYPSIGRIFGGKDHTTVFHGIKKIRALMLTDADLAFSIALLIEEITGAQG